MTAPAPDPALDQRIQAELVDMLFAGARVAVATTFIGPVLVGWLFLPLLGPWMATLPALGILGLHAERAWFIARFQRARRQPDYHPRPWARGTQWRLAVMGGAISLWVLAVFITRDPQGVFLSAALLVVLAAGSLQYSVYPGTIEHYLTPLLLGCAAQMVWLGSAYWVPAFFLVVAWLTLVAASRRFGRTMRHNIELRLRNEALNQALQEQKAVAEEASAAKTRFLTAASHDLRQPVQAVMLLSEALQERGENPDNRQLLRKLRAGAESFANTVDEIMDIAQLDAGNVHPHPEPIRVVDLLARVESTYRDVALAKGLWLIMRPPAWRDATVLADPALVWRIVSNLVSNAIRYTPSGTVMVAVRRCAPVAGVEGPHRPSLRLQVRDAGVGIDPSLHDQVFEEFFQADNLHRSRREGVGLGLAVARRLSLLMDLRLHLRSCPGHGSVFSLTLPLCPPGTRAVPAHSGSADLSALCVLVVEDDPAAREATLDLLRSWGVQAHGAGSVNEACRVTQGLLEQHQAPGVLLTDHWLPDGQSSESADAQVRALLARHGPPLARYLHTGVVTGDIRGEARERSLARGWMYWQKPVRPGELRQWLCGLAQQTAAEAGEGLPADSDTR